MRSPLSLLFSKLDKASAAPHRTCLSALSPALLPSSGHIQGPSHPSEVMGAQSGTEYSSCRIRHLFFFSFMPLMIAQCFRLSRSLHKAFHPSRESTAPPSLVSSAVNRKGLVFGLPAAVDAIQRCLGTGISTLQEIVTSSKKGIFAIFVMIIGALVGSCCGILQLMWMQGAEDVAQVPLGQASANLWSLWEQSPAMELLRKEIRRLAAEIDASKEEVRLMREAMSASTQMSDWALKEAGAAMDLQRSSSSSAGLCRVFWFLCAPAPQDTFVQPDALPGYCWPFQGSWSEVLIRLPTQITPIAITIQHTAKMASALVTVSSAPRDFTVSGLDEEGEQETLLGTFTYTLQKGPNQTFPLQNGIPRGFRFLKLGIRSNWGKPGYTCIYRVQVHGKIVGRKAVGQTPV
ncbi:sperm-associated antigen 4 protein-like [Chroicocephalus ridibundus]|uniref:sperm-associated antigen 4 protein-like n=1 Tax=Chroicocephalus ridibundus TaxID=1192867 RepID=UPI002FDEDA06